MFTSYTRYSLKRWVFSLRRKIERVSAVLKATGSSFHHRGARTENSLHRAELPPGARSGVAFRRPEEAERNGPCGCVDGGHRLEVGGGCSSCRTEREVEGLEADPCSNREPVQVYQQRGHVGRLWQTRDQPGCCVLEPGRCVLGGLCDKKVRSQPNAVIPRLHIFMEGRIQALATYKYIKIIV